MPGYEGDFSRGTRARAVRDVAARHIQAGDGAADPYAVATARIQAEGVAPVERGLPRAEVEAELREQAADAAGSRARREDEGRGWIPPRWADNPSAEGRHPAPGRSRDVRVHAHSHGPGHHRGSCNDGCRRGRVGHMHSRSRSG